MRVLAACIICLAATGCGTTPPPPKGTGARDAAVGFFEAVVGHDSERAYRHLAKKARSQTRQQFAARAESYCRHTGIDPKEARVTSCDEKDSEAIAHVVLVNGSKRYKDAVTLHREGTAWRVSLPAQFGQKEMILRNSH